MKLLGDFFSTIYNFCFSFSNNHWIAIIIFTLLSKIILLPVSIIVQKNSIKMVKMYPQINRIKTKYFGNGDMISEKQYELYKRENYHPLFDIIPAIIQVIVLMGVVKGFPNADINNSIIMTILAGLSSYILCEVQNKANVLQQEQSKANQISVMIFSICLSLFLAVFVTKYVVFYWICSNLMSAIQVFVLNFFINPKKHIDYEDLENSKKELDTIKEQNAKIKTKRNKELVLRENNDYKRFLKYENKQIVFYSEKNGFYKYYKDIIEIILKKTDIIIHYISSDPNDEIFKLTSDNFQTYYIEEKLMVLMMRMDADVVVMTTPDLQNYYIKRSMVRDDIEYVYIDHSTNSNNLTYHKDALAHFDTIFVQNTKNYEEIKAQEKKYNFKTKNLVKVGFPLIDNMIKSYNEQNSNNKKTILIAPSWQEDNILDSCIDNLLDELLDTDYDVIVRPHPQYVRLYGEKLELIRSKYSKYNNFNLQTDFSSNKTVYDADILITDWSAICFEYSFTTLKPVIFINTPMKVINPDYKDINIVPFDIEARNQIGVEVELNNVGSIKEKLKELETSSKYTKESIKNIRDNYLYNIGKSAKYGAKYLVDSLIEKSKIVEVEKETKEEVNKKPSFINKYINAFIISLFLCLMLFYFSPMEVYLGNYYDFGFPMNNAWWILLIYSLSVSLIISTIVSIFPYNVSKFLCLLELSGGLLCYNQILFLNNHVESLFVTNEETIFSTSVCVTNIVVWFLFVIICIIVYYKFSSIKNNFYNISKFISISLIVVQLFGFVASYNKLTERTSKTNYLSDLGEFELSSKKNTLVFLLDMCDGDYVKETLEKYPNIFDNLDGFTYYPDATTTYSRTYPSVPYLLTGEKCFYDKPVGEYVSEAWDKTNYIPTLKKDDVSVGVYTQTVFISENAKNYVDNFSSYDCYDIKYLDIKALIQEMTVLSGYRCAPYFVKMFINKHYPSYVNRIVRMPSNNCIESDDPTFYDELLKRGLKTTNQYDDAFRFYHFMSTHGWMSANVEYLKPGEEESHADTIFADFVILNEYFRKMKELGIYDNSTIIITTDHGKFGKKIEGDSTLTGIMLIKQPNEKGKLKTSDLSVCHDDLFELMYNHKDINEIVSNNLRKRYMYIASNYESESIEYEIVGDSRRVSNWKKTGNVWDIQYSMYEIVRK